MAIEVIGRLAPPGRPGTAAQRSGSSPPVRAAPLVPLKKAPIPALLPITEPSEIQPTTAVPRQDTFQSSAKNDRNVRGDELSALILEIFKEKYSANTKIDAIAKRMEITDGFEKNTARQIVRDICAIKLIK
ncbi:hypothetical protein [Devosia sp.]|uniref:hypothetical protein n=1 Tax=Devosia sp. TaxID=1871048 RepID=UPI003F6F9C6A